MAKNLVRDGAPKNVHTPAVHSGMHHRTRDGQLVFDQTDHAPVASGGLMRSTVPGKTYAQPAPAGNDRHRHTDAPAGNVPGDNIRNATREVDHALGQKILDEAYAAGSEHDRATRRGFLPLKT
jgi:hypothetical protein